MLYEYAILCEARIAVDQETIIQFSKPGTVVFGILSLSSSVVSHAQEDPPRGSMSRGSSKARATFCQGTNLKLPAAFSISPSSLMMLRSSLPSWTTSRPNGKSGPSGDADHLDAVGLLGAVDAELAVLADGEASRGSRCSRGGRRRRRCCRPGWRRQVAAPSEA